jgi:hypothetical protein
MLLQSPIRIMSSQPLERAEPIKLLRDSDSKQAAARVFGRTRQAAASDQAAVVHFGSRALGLARNQPPPADGALADTPDATSVGTASVDRTRADAAPVGTTSADATLAASTTLASTLAGAAPAATPAADAPDATDEPSGAEPEALSDDERQSVDEMKRRDREVRTHEQAHKAAGGSYAGSMRLSYQMGPDGKRYAVSGSVPIDVSPVAGDPAATLRKMEVVSRAANAPASPSGPDRAVAGQAARAMQQARAQLAAERYAKTRDAIPGA